MRRIVLGSVVCLLATVHATVAEDWPQWRGPSGQGVSATKDLPVTWGGPNSENVLWRVPLLEGAGAEKAKRDHNQSSPVVAKGRVFTTMCYWPEGTEQKEYPRHEVACFDLVDGRRIWTAEIEPGPWKLSDLRGGYAAPTPATDGERVYVVFGSAVIAALENASGKIVWRKEVVPFDFDVAMAASPILVGENVLLVNDQAKRQSSNLTAFDRKTGEIRWQTKRDTGFAHSTPVLAKIGDREQLLVAASGQVQGVDPATGSLLWWATAKGDTASPVYGGGLVFCDSGRGGKGTAVDPTGSGDLSATHTKWVIPQIPEGYGSPIIAGEYLYRVHNPGILKCWKLATGEEVYAERLQGASVSASPALTVDGRLYLASGGKSYVVAAGPKFELLGTSDLGDPSSASAAIGEGKIVLKGAKTLFCVGR